MNRYMVNPLSWDPYDLAWCDEHKCHPITCEDQHVETTEKEDESATEAE